MKYYLYFDGFGLLRRTVNENELAERYGNDRDAFLRAMRDSGGDGEIATAIGHVGTFCCEHEHELKDYLESLGDEICGFYECDSGSRPYNF